jgi:hypothetical protein
METYLNLDGVECVIVQNEDGTTWSGLKSAYEATLASELSNPSTPQAGA